MPPGDLLMVPATVLFEGLAAGLLGLLPRASN